MAITRADCVLWRALRDAGLIPDRPAVLEIGKANWYGDVPAAEFVADVAEYGPGVVLPEGGIDPWAAAGLYYRALLREPTLTAIDLDPNAPGEVIGFDLNYGVHPRHKGRYDIVINTGTAEHIFNQGQVWETMHDACKAGGLMAHAMPLWGWLDHGFVNYQPTFVADLAAANGYEILVWLFAELKPPFVAEVRTPSDVHLFADRARERGAMMHVAFRKATAAAFAVPVQGIYRDRPTEDHAAWMARR